MEANIYKPPTVGEMELSSPQYLLLGLLHSLVTGDMMSSILLGEICFQVEKLKSRHYKVWLLEDFIFPQSDIKKAMALLSELATNSVLKLPPHVLGIMVSLANKYGANYVQLRNFSEEWCNDQLKNAVGNNNPGEIIAIVAEGGDLNEPTQTGDSLMHLAARAGNCAAIAALGFLKVDLEAVNSRNATPLMEAIENNHVSSVKSLITAGANLSKRFYRGDTYLHIAAAGGSNGALEVLLERGMNVNEKNFFGETPLFQAVRTDNVQGMEILLENDADSSILPEKGKSLTEMVLESRNPDMLKVFIKSGADLKLKDGDTVLHLVARLGNLEMLKGIKNKKFQGSVKNQSGLTPLHVASDPSVVRMFVRMGIDINSKTEKNETALHLAAAKGSIELVKDLVRLGAAVDLQDERGTSALMIALKNSKLDIANFLLYNGANPNIKDKEGCTPLHYAAEVGCVESVTALLHAGVEVDVQDINGNTAAFIAAINNKPDVLKLLVENGADLNLRYSNSDGIIHCVASRGHIEAMMVLLDTGLEVDTKGNSGWTALYWASWRGYTPIVKALLDAGADPEAKDKEGYTPLMRASNKGHLTVVQLLIDRGVNANNRDNNGRTALHWAKTNGNKSIHVVDYLESIGGVQ